MGLFCWAFNYNLQYWIFLNCSIIPVRKELIALEFCSELLSEKQRTSLFDFNNIDFLFYLNFSNQASRTNFICRPIEIYNLLNCSIIPVGKKNKDSLNFSRKCSRLCFLKLLMQILVYLNFSNQASRTNFVGRSIAIYNTNS